jgi:hypothetical protein
MTRPVDENGRPLPPASRRLPNAAALQMAGVTAISADPRSCFMDLKRKLELSSKAINHAVDGAAVPKDVQGGGRCSGAVADRPERGAGGRCEAPRGRGLTA